MGVTVKFVCEIMKNINVFSFCFLSIFPSIFLIDYLVPTFLIIRNTTKYLQHIAYILSKTLFNIQNFKKILRKCTCIYWSLFYQCEISWLQIRWTTYFVQVEMGTHFHYLEMLFWFFKENMTFIFHSKFHGTLFTGGFFCFVF